MAKFAVWHCYADGKPFGTPYPVDASPQIILNNSSSRLHIEPIDDETWEILSDRQHDLHQSMMEEMDR